MIKELIENSMEFATFKELVEFLSKKLKLKLIYFNEGDSYAEFQTKDRKIFKITQTLEGMQYSLKILDEDGVPVRVIPQSKFMDNDGWYIGDYILNVVEDTIENDL